MHGIALPSRLTRAAVWLTACGLLAPLPSLAFTSKRPPTARLADRRRPAPAPPAPTVPVQLAGLRAGEGRSFTAVMHALRRDALPGLTACYASHQPRGMVHVELTPDARGRWTVADVTSARRDRAVEDCVRGAVARVSVPPSEDAEESPVAFSVAFGMRAFGGR